MSSLSELLGIEVPEETKDDDFVLSGGGVFIPHSARIRKRARIRRAANGADG